MTAHLILVRHGQTTWNHEGRFQGQTDVELSALGRAQARRLGNRLAGEPIAAVYSSDLQRCLETAHLATADRGLPVESVAALREVSLGVWQGLTRAEIESRYPGDLARVRADPVSAAPTGGETRRALQDRLVEAICAIATRHDDEQVLVVTHGGSLAALACWVLMADLRADRRLGVDNCAVCRVDVARGEPRLRLWNDVGHLDGLVDPVTVGTQPE